MNNDVVFRFLWFGNEKVTQKKRSKPKQPKSVSMTKFVRDPFVKASGGQALVLFGDDGDYYFLIVDNKKNLRAWVWSHTSLRR